jgi:DNA repair exonuclease SbcCD ATPase subunit
VLTLSQTLAVFEYMNKDEVKKRLQASVKNVDLELQNVNYLTGETINLAKMWGTFIEDHLTNIEAKAKEWLKTRIDTTETKITEMITTLEKREDGLKKKETSKDKATYEKKTKEDSDKLDKEIETAKDAVATQKTVLKNAETGLEAKRDASAKKKTELKDEEAKLTAIVKQIAAEKDKKKLADLNTEKTTLEGQIAKIKAEKSTADNARTKAQREREKAQRALLTKEKALGRKQRAMRSLRSKWLAEVIADLKKDQVVVAKFKKAAAMATMPKPV